MERQVSFFKRFLMVVPVALLCALGMGAGNAAFASPAEESTSGKTQSRLDFVHSMATMTLSVMQDQKKSYADRRTVLRQCFNNVVDVNWIARFVLGSTWNKASAEQRKEYTELYRTYLANTYVSDFAEDYEKRISDIKIVGIKNGSDSRFTVNTEMALADANVMKVDYLVSDTAGKYKVIDIIIEGVSLLSTHRSEFAALAADRGVDAVIAKLQQAISRQSSVTLSMK